MKRFLVPVLAGAAALALVVLLAYGLTTRSEDTSIDEAVARGERPVAASRPLPVLGGSGTRSLADLRGKVVVLNFWASWCTPCKAEAPVLAAAQERLERDGHRHGPRRHLRRLDARLAEVRQGLRHPLSEPP